MKLTFKIQKKTKKNKKRDWITHPIRNLYRMTTRLAAVNEWHKLEFQVQGAIRPLKVHSAS
jgi:hypothetical protein